MPTIPRFRGPSPAEHAPAPIVVTTLPVDLEAGYTRHVRRAVGVTRNVATVATSVPFMPLPARVAAGAVTGVATVVDAALRPSTERPQAPTRPAPTDDDILHDPALFAADAAGALATGVLAAGEALVVGAKSPLLRRTIKVGLVAAAIVTVGAIGYRLVVGPALVRRRERRSRETALIVVPDAQEMTFTIPESDGAPGGHEAGIADALAREAAEPVVEAALILEPDTIEPVEDGTAVEAADAARGGAEAGIADILADAAAEPAAEAKVGESVEDGAAATVAPADAAPQPGPKKRRFGRRAPAAPSDADVPAADAPAEPPAAPPRD